MVAALSDISGLPYWPRLLSEDQAAAYVGVSRETFRQLVKAGTYPQRREGKRVLYDRRVIDRIEDMRSGLTGTDSASDEEWSKWQGSLSRARA